jgi:hypothetical protein
MSTINQSTALRGPQRNSYHAPWYALNLDNVGNIVFANSHVERLFQRPMSELAGHAITAFITDTNLPESLHESIIATRTTDIYLETTCQLTCNDITAEYDVFARYFSDKESFIFMFTEHYVASKILQLNETIQQFITDTLTESDINNVMIALQKNLTEVNIGVFCLLLQQPINIAQHTVNSNMDFTGLWIFGQRLPPEAFVTLQGLITFLSSQANNSTDVQFDPVTSVSYTHLTLPTSP